MRRFVLVLLLPILLGSAIYAGHTSTPIAWQRSAWVVDYGNSTNKADDSNDCATAQTPCKTVAAIAARSGCFGTTLCSQLLQATSLTFLSDDPEPIVVDVQALAGGTLVIQGVASIVGTVSLSAVTPKSYTAGSNALLSANLGATASVGQPIENETHASRAWAYAALGGNAFSLTQPLVEETAAQTSYPPRVDTWTSGDSVSLLSYPKVNLVRVHSMQPDWNATRSNPLVLYHLVVSDPNGAGADNVEIGPNVLAIESQFQRTVILDAGANGNAFPTIGHDTGNFGYPLFLNCQFMGGLQALGAFGIIAGSLKGATAIAGGGAESAIDADFIVGQLFAVSSGIVSIGPVYLDASLDFAGSAIVRAIDNGHGYGDQVWYGNSSAQVFLLGKARLENHAQTFTQAFTLASLATTGFVMNLSSTTACSHTNGSPDVRYCDIPTTVANLDAPAGPSGFGGHAESFAGSSISTDP